MTKADIIARVSTRIGLSKADAADIVESIFAIIKERLARGEKVKISGFGNFVIRTKRARVGRNPHTGEPLTLAGRRVLTFTASPVLKAAINRLGDEGFASHRLSDSAESPS